MILLAERWEGQLAEETSEWRIVGVPTLWAWQAGGVGREKDIKFVWKVLAEEKHFEKIRKKKHFHVFFR
jgi:hypothetical protein